MRFFLFSLIFLITACSHHRKVSMKPLMELTLHQINQKDMAPPMTIPEEKYQADNNYVFDLYFLIANDAYYQGCFEIAHNGFVFLYNNDHRPGSKEFISKKFKDLREKLIDRAYHYKMGYGPDYDKYYGYFCEEFKDSLN